MPMLREHAEQPEQPKQADRIPVPVSLREALRQEALGQEKRDMRLSRKLSEESIRTELCEGPVPDCPLLPGTPEQNATTCSDRTELIERLKRGESPTWVPNRHLESLFHQTDPPCPTRSPRPPSSGSTTLLPPAAIPPEKGTAGSAVQEAEDRLREGLDIERPRSALHSGDFRHDESSRSTLPARVPTSGDAPNRDRLSSHPWFATSPPRAFALDFERRQPLSTRTEGLTSTASSLASSLSQSFAYMPPTSPLVQSESNDDLADLSLPLNNINITRSGSQTSNPSRRHTLHFYPSSPYSHTALSRHVTPSRESSHPYQAHQPRRSLTSAPNLTFPGSGPSPQTPGHGHLGSRRQSISSDASPLLHASMVGSYEESILRGRMSTTPSKPLDFQAEIGVLGLGKCKQSLRCPAHVTVPFSAVFYSYASTTHGRTISEDGPSPYVGQIDLENGLSNPEDEHRARRKMQTRYPERTPLDHNDMDMEASLADGSELEARTSGSRRRRSRSPKAPPGGSYRIPEKGMLQIIIKNQNKTAVKLFLVRYDLAGMEPGTKTFVRQRSYSDPEDASSTRPILRYLIQLHICCPAKGRHYLYKSIRVVFANRVPDGKEKLRNEVTYPEPRFSPYKPTRVMLPTQQQPSSGPAMALAAEKAFRRRSSGFPFAGRSHSYSRPQLDALDGVIGGGGGEDPGGGPAASSPLSVRLAAATGRSSSSSSHVVPSGTTLATGAGNNIPVDPLPLRLPGARRVVVSNAASSTSDEMKDSRLPLHDSRLLQLQQQSLEAASGGANDGNTTELLASRPPGEGLAWDDRQAGLDTYDKLSKGDVGYGGIATASAATEGLLAKSLRSLGVVNRAEEEEEDN